MAGAKRQHIAYQKHSTNTFHSPLLSSQLSLPKNDTIEDWLMEHGKTDLKIKKAARGTGKLMTSTGYGGKKKVRKKARDPNEDEDYIPVDKKKAAKDEIKKEQKMIGVFLESELS